jgi:hypothetical protein
MEIPKTSARSASKSSEVAPANKAGAYGRSPESDCARAMAQAKSVLREISLMQPHARRSSRELPSAINEKAESAASDFATVSGTKPYTHSDRAARQFGVFDLRLAKTIPDCLTLDPGLDFVIHANGGAIELTETGFWRMVQAHSAGLDVVIGVDRRDLLRFPAQSSAEG